MTSGPACQASLRSLWDKGCNGSGKFHQPCHLSLSNLTSAWFRAPASLLKEQTQGKVGVSRAQNLSGRGEDGLYQQISWEYCNVLRYPLTWGKPVCCQGQTSQQDQSRQGWCLDCCVSLTLGAPSSDFVETEIGTASLGSRTVICDSLGLPPETQMGCPIGSCWKTPASLGIPGTFSLITIFRDPVSNVSEESSSCFQDPEPSILCFSEDSRLAASRSSWRLVSDRGLSFGDIQSKEWRPSAETQSQVQPLTVVWGESVDRYPRPGNL